MSALLVEPVEITQEDRRNTVTLRKYIISVMLTLAIAVWAGCDGGGGHEKCLDGAGHGFFLSSFVRLADGEASVLDRSNCLL